MENNPIGSCMTMCPHSETEMRELEGLLHPFEMVENGQRSKRPRCKPEKMVKEYKRPAAGQDKAESSNLRPVPVLHKTIDYLYTCILSRPNTAWSLIYDYTFDRLRAVRQDMVIQDIQGLDAISLLEKITRFYIFTVYRMGTKITSSFDPTINNQHTQECLKRLLSLYRDIDGPHYNQMEFESIYLMFNLGETPALLHYLELPLEIRNSSMVKSAYYSSINYLLCNYIRCLREIRKQPSILCLCAAQRHLCKIQQNALYMMNVGHNSKDCKYPTWRLEDLLLFNSQDATEDTCQKCGLLVKDGVVCFQKTQFKQENKVSWKPWQHLENLISRTNLTNLLLGSTDIAEYTDISRLSLHDS